MRWLSLLMLPMALCAGLSCTPDAPQSNARAEGSPALIKNQPNHGATAAATPAPSPNRPINASAAAPSGNTEAAPVPPKGAQYTIFCRDFPGPSHVDFANQAKAELMRNTKLRGWYVLHLEDHSSLMYGYYKSQDDPAARADRATIERLTDQLSNRLFPNCIVMPIDAPDPSAPPEWNLGNLRRDQSDTQHYWSLQIAAFRDNPQRKQAAIEMVRELRSQGTEAYYYHGKDNDSVSIVCVGCWPMEALKRQDSANAEAASPNPDEKVLVSPSPMPDNVRRKYKAEGITVVQTQVEVVDPKMRDTMNAFPQHFVNYQAEGVQVAGKIVPKPSAIVPIPVKESSALSANGSAPPPPPDAVRALSPDPSRGAGTGRLKGIK